MDYRTYHIAELMPRALDGLARRQQLIHAGSRTDDRPPAQASTKKRGPATSAAGPLEKNAGDDLLFHP